MAAMFKMNGRASTTLKKVAIWLKMNGFMITHIRLGSILSPMVLMRIRNGKKWMASGITSRSGATWLKMSGKEAIS